MGFFFDGKHRFALSGGRSFVVWIPSLLDGGVSAGFENLPPFWAVYGLVRVETIGEGVLAIPIAVAKIGPLAGVGVLIVIGLVNMVLTLPHVRLENILNASGPLTGFKSFEPSLFQLVFGVGSIVAALGLFYLVREWLPSLTTRHLIPANR